MDGWFSGSWFSGSVKDVCMSHQSDWISVLSIRASSWPKQLATGQTLAGYFRLTLLLILIGILKQGKDPTKIIDTSASNV